MIEAKIRKWGNSFGVVIPKSTAEELGLHENQKVAIEVKDIENPLKELYGALKFRKPTKELLRDVRKDFSKYL